MISFADTFIPLLLSNAQNLVENNYDWRRFGKDETDRLAALKEEQEKARYDIAAIRSHVGHLDWLWNKLEDDASRGLLVSLLLYRCLGSTRIQLPLSNPGYWGALDQIDELMAKLPRQELGYHGWHLSQFDLTNAGFPCKVWARPTGIYTQFLLRQYQCQTAEHTITVAPGDIVIDGGGCFGETALYFASLCGPEGRVITVEFGKQNLEVLSANLSLNPQLASRVEVVEQPLWGMSGVRFSFEGEGPGTHLTRYRDGSGDESISSVTIDEIVRERRCERVDFIKMDIEGAELAALKGAEFSIRKFRPKLAISIYHKIQDFWEIPHWIESLGLGYKFHIRHFTTHAEETVLFAEASTLPSQSAWGPKLRPLEVLRAESEIMARWGVETKPRVSVCCAAFNHSEYIDFALASFLDQNTAFPFEIIVRDDASSDGTAEIVANYAEKYPNIIRLLREEVNQFSKGVRSLHVWPEVAKGEFIAICEGDDFWVNPDKLQRQVDLLDANPDAVMCVAESVICKDKEGQISPVGVSGRSSGERVSFEELKQCYFHTSTYCVRRKPFSEVIFRYFAGHCLFGDTALRFLLITYGPFVRLPHVVSVYRDTGRGIWTSLSESNQLQWEIDCASRLITLLSGEHRAFQESKLEALLLKKAASAGV